jgi:hypothetical protein
MRGSRLVLVVAMVLALAASAEAEAPLRTVAGQVYRSGGPSGRGSSPVAGVTIEATTVAGPRRTVGHGVSRRDGAFVLHVAPGSYELSAYVGGGRSCGFTHIVVHAETVTGVKLVCSIR